VCTKQRWQADDAVRVRATLAFNPESEYLYTLSLSRQLLYELSERGEVLSQGDAADLHLRDPQSLAVAPSGDATGQTDPDEPVPARSGHWRGGGLDLAPGVVRLDR
jgi:hypothetical protein